MKTKPVKIVSILKLGQRFFFKGGIILCAILLASCKASVAPQGQLVKVEQALSGQTIKVVSIGDLEAIPKRVRLIGISAPDLKQLPWGPQARSTLVELIGDQPVLLEFDVQKQDRYQRQLGYIWRERELINEQMVKQGYALAMARSPNNKYDQRLLNAQEWARIMGLGIWDPKNPMRLTPTDFRHQNRY